MLPFRHLLSLTATTAAEVILEHQWETKPAFRVQVRLEVPDPGMHQGQPDAAATASISGFV